MATIARRDNVRAIRAGIAIPEQRPADLESIMFARLSAKFEEDAYELAQTEPNSDRHRQALYMAKIDRGLPCNNLRLIVTPVVPRAEWLNSACNKVRIAKAALELADSQWAHAWHLDRCDEGERAKALSAERDEKRAALDRAILDALRTPSTRRSDVARKQEMIGKREWAVKYRPDWQAIVDEDLARFPVKARPARKQEGC